MNGRMLLVGAAAAMLAAANGMAGSAEVSFDAYPGATIEGFQAPIVLSEGKNGFTYDGFAATDGSDLRIADAETGELVPYEIEKWDVAGTSIVWARVPRFSRTTRLALTWGDAEAASAAEGNIWTDMSVVCHMSAGAAAKDSSASGISFSAPEDASAAGEIGDAHTFGTVARKLAAEGLTEAQAGNMATQFTVSCWMQIENLDQGNRYAGGFFGGGGQHMMLYGFRPRILELFAAGQFSGTDPRYLSGIDVPDTGWHQYAYTYDGTLLKLYRDGACVRTSNVVFAFDSWGENARQLFIGGSDNGNNELDGALDEVRIEPVVRSGDWIAAAYLTQGGLHGESCAIEFPEYASGAELADFPALVVLNERISGFSYSRYGRNGEGLYFTDGEKALPHEIELWASNANSYVWVNVPAMKKGATVHVCWTPAGIGTAACNASLWPEPFLGVWHLQSTAARRDSTESGIDFYPVNNQRGINPPATDGPTGRYNALRTLKYWSSVSMPYTSSIALGKSFTMSWWAKRDDFDAPCNSYFLQICGENSKWQWAVLTGYGTSPYNTFKLWTSDGAPIMNIPDAGWHYYAFVGDDASCTGYCDGVAVYSGGPYNIDIPDLKAANLYLGGSNIYMADPFSGHIDELRIETAPRSAEWIRACYENQRVFEDGADRLAMPGFAGAPKAEAAKRGTLDFTAQLSCSQDAQVFFASGASNGGESLAAWDSAQSLGTQANGAVSASVERIAYGQRVYGRFFASNAWGVAWSPAVSGWMAPEFSSCKAAISCAAYTGTETLHDFPLCVRISGLASLPDTARKLRFTNGGLAALPFEAEQWDPAGESIIWVRVPELNADTQLVMEWTNASADDGGAWSAEDMWGDECQRVWHGANVDDSGRYGAKGIGAAVIGNGPVGPCFTFNGAADGGGFYTESKPLLDFCQGGTFSYWARCDKDCGISYIFECLPWYGGFQLGAIVDKWENGFKFYPENVSAYGIRDNGFSDFLASANGCTQQATGDEEWHHFAYTYNGLDMAAYYDGVQTTNVNFNICLGSGQPGRVDQCTYIGCACNSNTRYFKGGLDELRIERIGRPASWIKACHDNQAGMFPALGRVSKRGMSITVK